MNQHVPVTQLTNHQFIATLCSLVSLITYAVYLFVYLLLKCFKATLNILLFHP